MIERAGADLAPNVLVQVKSPHILRRLEAALTANDIKHIQVLIIIRISENGMYSSAESRTSRKPAAAPCRAEGADLLLAAIICWNPSRIVDLDNIFIIERFLSENQALGSTRETETHVHK